MRWVLDIIVLLIAFAISPILGFAWLMINAVFLIIQAIGLHAQAQLIQRQQHWEEEKQLRYHTLDDDDDDE